MVACVPIALPRTLSSLEHFLSPKGPLFKILSFLREFFFLRKPSVTKSILEALAVDLVIYLKLFIFVNLKIVSFMHPIESW